MTLAEELADFVYREARLLDAGAFTDWLALFAEDGRYWVPLEPAQSESDRSAQSIADEDLMLLRIRIARLENPRAYSLHPPVRCQHVLQQPRIERADDAPEAGAGRQGAEFLLHTPFMYAERRAEEQLVLFGTARHRLRRGPAGLQIVLKRIDLLGADTALPSIYLFL
jgi:3-phenylpropionate/cinnamic acid dioxygenase small subunit